MKIAFIGQKGIPAIWGGIETHVEELAGRLAARGHDVTVYVRNWYTPEHEKFYKGIKLKHIPCIYTKYLDAATHTFNSSLNSLFNPYDIIHYQAIGPSLFCWIPKIFGKKVFATIHRFDYESDNWGYLAKKVLKFSEKFALSIPDKTIVVAKYQEEIYRSRGYNPVYIPNGVNIPGLRKADIIKKEYNLENKKYILYMGRLVPEKRCEWLIDAFKKIDSVTGNNLKLVISGGSSNSDDYINMLKNLGKDNDKIIFTGYVSGIKKEELYSNALLFVLPSRLEGLPIVVLEASSYSLPILVSDIAPHKEVIKDKINGFFFLNRSYLNRSYSNLASRLREIILLPAEKLEKVGLAAKENVIKNYNWDFIVDKTEKAYLEVASPKGFKVLK